MLDWVESVQAGRSPEEVLLREASPCRRRHRAHLPPPRPQRPHHHTGRVGLALSALPAEGVDARGGASSSAGAEAPASRYRALSYSDDVEEALSSEREQLPLWPLERLQAARKQQLPLPGQRRGRMMCAGGE